MTSVRQWIIIGGGIHGTYLANLLVNRLGVEGDDLRVIDPHDTFLATWSRNTANCGMHYLRSPATHNIDLHILSLYRYARTPAGKPFQDYIPPYNRPSLELFRRHCEHVIRINRLNALRLKGRVHALRDNRSSILVDTTAGKLKSRNVLLAIGLGEQPEWPEWARSLRLQGADVRHLFSPDFDRRALKPVERTAVIGGGVTAVQVALKLAEEQQGHIVVLSGHRLRAQSYDFNPCWIGPKCLTDYYKLNYRQRREIIDRERIPGTIPPEVLDSFKAALKNGNPGFQRERVIDAAGTADGILLRTEAGSHRFDRVILATGFEAKPPGSPLTEQVMAEFNLSCNPCGYPIVGRDLRWGEHIFVTGPLAELQLGPCARNIVGARNAGRFLTAVLGK
jgi:thioredoxin reductase